MHTGSQTLLYSHLEGGFVFRVTHSGKGWMLFHLRHRSIINSSSNLLTLFVSS